MKKWIALCACAMMFLCPISAMAETKEVILELPGDDGTQYPTTGISYGYNNQEDVTTVVVPENILRLGEKVFSNNINLSDIQFHSNLQKIGEDAFLETAYYNNPENWDQGVLYIGDCLIKADKYKIGDTYEVRPGTRLIADSAFADCENLREILLPDSLEYVGEDAFGNTAFYNTPENWEQGVLILDYLLLDVDKDYTGVLEVTEGIRTIADGAARDCMGITEVRTPESLVHIGQDAFANCESLEKVSLGKNVETLGRGPLYQCFSLKEILLNDENLYFQTYDGLLLNEEMNHIVKCPQQAEGSVEIPKHVTIIDAYAFESCEKLEEAELPENCVFIGTEAFSGCENLLELKLPENMEYIDHYAFTGCCQIDMVVVPENVTYLGKGVFKNCKNVQAAVIGDGITQLQEELFAGCDNLIAVQLGEDINWISHTSFQDTKYISNVRLYENGVLVTSDKYLMKVAPDVQVCDIPDGVEVIADGAFEYLFDENLQKVCLPKSLKSYNWFAFSDLSKDVKICYDGTAREFAELADDTWECVNLSTKDFRGMTISVLVLSGIFGLFFEMLDRSNNLKEDELEFEEGEDDYEEE